MCGDFNAKPDEPCHKIIQEAGFISSFFDVNGKEPDITFPTGLQGPYM